MEPRSLGFYESSSDDSNVQALLETPDPALLIGTLLSLPGKLWSRAASWWPDISLQADFRSICF